MWQVIRPLGLLAAAVAVLVLGTIGFQEVKGNYSLTDAIYASFQLFTFGGGVPISPPWELEIARFLGPVLVGYAAVRGLLILFREQIKLVGFRFFLNDHVIIAGLGEVNLELAERFHNEGAQVVAIEENQANPGLAACRERGIPVLIGNAADPELLKRVQVKRAAYMLVSCGRDQIDMDVIKAVRDALRQRHSFGELTVFVHLDDPALWRAVKRLILSTEIKDSLRLEPFNLLDGAARLMTEETPELHEPRALTRVVIAADSMVGEAIALHAARTWLNSCETGQRLEIELIGPTADELLSRLEIRHPKLLKTCRLRATGGDLESKRIYDRARGAAAVYVAFSDEARGLTAALAMQKAVALEGGNVTLMVRRGTGGIARAAKDSGLRVFAAFKSALSVKFLERGTNEVIARALHRDYLEAERAKPEPPKPNPSAVEWEGLKPTLRESNRRCADGIAAKLNKIRAVAVPDPLVKLGIGSPFEFTKDEIHNLAVMEHDRWVEERKSDGWRYSAGEKDDDAKLHPCLVPWDKLTPENQEKDRQKVRAIPDVLAEAGYRIERVPPRQPVREDSAAESPEPGPSPGADTDIAHSASKLEATTRARDSA